MIYAYSPPNFLYTMLSRWPVQTVFFKYRPSDFESNPKVLWREIPVVNDPLNRNALLREKVPQGFGDDSSLVIFFCRIDGQTFWWDM